MLLPFGVLLGCMAFLPLHLPQWWERNYGKVCGALAAIPLVYYAFILPETARATVAETGRDYAGFIVLIGALYVVSGGIHLAPPGSATPLRNVLFLALGGLVSNVLGTTGASMLLIRPWLRMNGARAAAHHVVFFIFIVSNVGGCLTPIGDPPLLVGYLNGVPFWWVAAHCWTMWLLAMAFLLGVFYIFDNRDDSRRPEPTGTAAARWHVDGLWNLVCIAVIIAAVFLPSGAREGTMIAAAAASFLFTNKTIHAANRFSFVPICEVAVLFFAIFATMMPALDILRADANRLFGAHLSSTQIYWNSGLISAFLDSAPAYLGFLSAMRGLMPNTTVIQLTYTAGANIAALSAGTVLFGAMTYLGNGPNLMVKAMADHEQARSPAFLSFLLKWAVPILLPLLIIEWLVFFR